MTREAMAEAFLAMRPALERQAMRSLSCAEDAEDVIQNVFLRAWLYCGSLREDDCFAAWIRRITAHETAGFLRGINPTAPLDEAVLMRLESDEDAIAGHMDFQQAVLTMSKPLRTAFCLYYLHGYSIKEIAVRMGCPKGTAGRRLHAARQWMRRQLNETKR